MRYSKKIQRVLLYVDFGNFKRNSIRVSKGIGHCLRGFELMRVGSSKNVFFWAFVYQIVRDLFFSWCVNFFGVFERVVCE